MALYPGSAPAILRPVNPLFIAFSLGLAMVLNMLPWGRDWVVPDFLALVLVFWNIKQPRKVGMGLAWVFGMLMDVHEASVLGEHALAYSLLSYFAITLHRRVPWFSVTGQMAHLFPLFLSAQLVTWAVRLLTGGMSPTPWMFLESILTTLLWPLVSALLMAPQRQPVNRDENRPL